ncbi:MAG: hypothetical protein JWL70_3217 [Acidimicrobiia bacterium]|nr:hypothetical protein [Acidimicrobiia bacterium]
MSTAEPIPDAYILRRVHEVLGTDSRVGDFSLSLELKGSELVVRGCVGTARRKAGVVPVVREALAALASSVTVRDETEVTPSCPPDSTEEVL